MQTGRERNAESCNECRQPGRKTDGQTDGQRRTNCVCSRKREGEREANNNHETSLNETVMKQKRYIS